MGTLTAVLGVLVFLALCALLIPYVLSLREPETRETFRAFIDSLGVIGVLLMLVLQMLQIIVAIIPGEPIEVLLGVMYGTFGGLTLSLLGIAIGQSAVYFLIRRYGLAFAAKFVDVKKFGNLKFLSTDSSRDTLVFLLFFIPGTPKDILTYFVPFTGMKFSHFIILTTLARIPSVASSTWAGATLSEGMIAKSAVIFAVTGIVGIAGILINERITKKRRITHNDKNNA